MKRLTIGAMVLAAGLTAARCGDDNNPTGPSNTGPILFTAQLSAANEVPPITNAESNGRGSATVTMNVPRDTAGNPTDGGTVNFSIQLSGFPAGSAAQAGHIHTGAAGVNGGVRVDTGLTPATAIVMADGTANISFNGRSVNAADAAAIYSNPAAWYVNVHTPLNPGGAVRGQLVRQQ